MLINIKVTNKHKLCDNLVFLHAEKGIVTCCDLTTTA